MIAIFTAKAMPKKRKTPIVYIGPSILGYVKKYWEFLIKDH